ncbi:TonB-dependent receptor [Flavobacterium cerinum]|uniref:TonB-dependent receptor n=1 Tax=Flavobacterium cerinum TaxID=2502784 RepID=A0A444GL69_9FLAO|nr:TonB-dependent receptor [Flavobacterium cerinum]RWW91744.1 TonB-dependent receptor [Flavobacterium cerinum]
MSFLSIESLNAQTKEFSAESLENRLNKIAQESKLNILFDATEQIKTAKVPALNGNGKTWEQILEASLQTTKYIYKKTGNSYAIINKPAPAPKRKPGKIKGKAVDNFGLSLPGVTIRIVETGLVTISDTDGNYTLIAEPGVYTVEASYISFQTQKITGVNVSEDNITPLNIALKEDANSLAEVVITKTYQMATASTEGMLLEQKNAAQLSDGISSEQIARTPDKDVGAVLKRITGVTTIDDKYVVVRSMGERWNQAVMDGINLPSTDAVQQQFSFDIIPTAMVESVVVSKSATPDMNANFAGGYVEVRTKAIPKEDFTSFSVGTSYNSRSAFKPRLTKQQAATDYLGFDDGRRDYPSLQNLSAPATEAESGPFMEQSKRFTQDNFTTYQTYGAPGTSLQFALGRAYDLKDGNRWGFVGSLIFKNTQEKLEIEHTERGNRVRNTVYTPEVGEGYSTLKQFGFKNYGASYNFNSTMGGMFNAGIQLGRHKLTVRNIMMHMYDATLTQTTGWGFYSARLEEILNGTDLPFTEEANYPVYQTFIQNKIEGEHKLGDLEIDWFAAYSTTSKDTKDATFTKQGRIKVGDDVLVGQGIYNADFDQFKRANFTNEEKNYNGGINFKYAFNFGESFHNYIKAGYFGTYKKATNQQESAGLAIVGQGTDVVLNINMPVSELLNGSNYKWGGYGWQRTTNYGKEYIGDVKIHSPFLMLDNKLTRFVRLVWGVRAESFVYTQIASQADNPKNFGTVQRDEKVWQYLPSINLTVSPTEKMNLRVGYNKSVLRPQFAERLNMPYYDPVRNAKVLNWTGGIVSTVVENYDFKAEWFPSRGEILSFGIYSKNMKDPIEAVAEIGGDGGTRTIYNMNSHSAKLWGIEMEIYKNLSFLGEGDALNRIFLYANAAVNNTKVTGYVNIDGTGGLYEANRPLYGQSPYNYNLGLDYIGDRLGFSVRHNGMGDQYLLVGFSYLAEEIRMPYGITDAQISYKFFKDKNLELKCGVKNLFDTAIETYSNVNSYTKGVKDYQGKNPRDQFTLGAGATDKYDEGIDNKFFKAWSGKTLSLSVNYSF